MGKDTFDYTKVLHDLITGGGLTGNAKKLTGSSSSKVAKTPIHGAANDLKKLLGGLTSGKASGESPPAGTVKKVTQTPGVSSAPGSTGRIYAGGKVYAYDPSKTTGAAYAKKLGIDPRSIQTPEGESPRSKAVREESAGRTRAEALANLRANASMGGRSGPPKGIAERLAKLASAKKTKSMSDKKVERITRKRSKARKSGNTKVTKRLGRKLTRLQKGDT